MTRLSVFLCPSDTPYANQNVLVAFTTYGDKGEPKSTSSLTTSQNWGRTNYVGMAGQLGSTGIKRWDRRRGVFTNRSRTRIEDVKDGASKTFMFGEVYGNKLQDLKNPPPSMTASATNFHNYAWMGVGGLPIIILGTTGTAQWAEIFSEAYFPPKTFNSEHAGIIFFCFVDGSVRAISKDIDQETFVRLGGMADGEEVKDEKVF